MIYFIRAGEAGAIKIGHARDVWRRLEMLQTGSHDTLSIIGMEEGGIVRERELHEKFRAHRSRGEWFSPAQEILEYAATLPRPMPRRNNRWKDAESGLGRYLAAHNMTLSEFSKNCGVAHSHLSRLLSGNGGLGWAALVRVRAATGGAVSIDEIIDTYFQTIAERKGVKLPAAARAA